MFIAFVEDDKLVTVGEFQFPISFSSKDNSSQTWSENWHFVILCHICGQVCR